ncbi:MAG: hypothetical protein COB24_02845 [Hyphomicrobiales bacterium]|nr:MAG: hypothetical protein COB24_02845 [Hyphomicrobiales bacterium]
MPDAANIILLGPGVIEVTKIKYIGGIITASERLSKTQNPKLLWFYNIEFIVTITDTDFSIYNRNRFA